MIDEYTLNLIKIGEEVEVTELTARGELRRRFLDLGIIKGTIIKALYKSVLGDPTAYSIRGTVIAIREEEASFIKVKSLNEEGN